MEYLVSMTVFPTYGLFHLIPSWQSLRPHSTYHWNFIFLLGSHCQVISGNCSVFPWRSLATCTDIFSPDATSDPAGKSALATYVWILQTTSALSIPLSCIALLTWRSIHRLNSNIQHNSTDSLGILEGNYNREEENLDVSYTPASRFCPLISGFLWAYDPFLDSSTHCDT